MDRFICHGLNELQIGSKQSMRVQKKEPCTKDDFF